MKVPFLDLAAVHAPIRAEIDDAIARVVDSSRFIDGPEVEAFESEFAAFVGAAHCVAMGNGLDALHLSLRALGVGPGDEVIVPSHTFVATWLAVTHCGATPVPVEPAGGGYNVDGAGVAQKVGPRTRCILPVHLYGEPADLDGILEVAARHGLPVLEDAAQAHGARYRGRPVGSHGRLAAWSFYPGKNLGALGDGGAVTTGDAQVAQRLRELRNYGSQRKYRHERQGFNSRLDAMQAAVLRVKLRHLAGWNETRRGAAARYIERLRGSSVRLPPTTPGHDSAWHLFVVRHPQRDALQRHLAAHGVETLVHYPTACHLQPAYASQAAGFGPLPAAERLSAEVLSLPMGPHLSPQAVDACVEAMLAFEGAPHGTH